MYFGAREVVGELLHKNRRDLPWPISLVSIENKGVGLQAIWVSGWDSQWKPSKYFLATSRCKNRLFAHALFSS
jgi:hypothetical protein